MSTISDRASWRPISTAPRDGSTIIGIYGGDEDRTSFIFWSERPVCMLGSRCGGYPPGWATAMEQDTDTNLPVDTPTHWMPDDPEYDADEIKRILQILSSKTTLGVDSEDLIQ